MDLKQHIRSVPDFPKAGILFYDITTLLRDPRGFQMTVDTFSSTPRSCRPASSRTLSAAPRRIRRSRQS
jgi:adenine phosphoribosyltransferase